MPTISRIHGREVLDSRGRPTVEVEVYLGATMAGRAIVPSGASTGRAEAIEYRDGDIDRYDGYGVSIAVDNVNKLLAPELIGFDPANQGSIDERLLTIDDTPRKSKVGANAILAVSLATAHAGAAARGVPLYQHVNSMWTGLFDGREASTPKMPAPMVNMISGGRHAGGNLDFQDVLIQPRSAPNYRTGLEWVVRVYNRLGPLLEKYGFEGRLIGDEGGYGPKLHSNEQAVEFVVRAIELARLRPGEDVAIALDLAASQFYREGFYVLTTGNDVRLTSDEMISRLVKLVEKYPIVSIEDGMAEEDWTGWQALTKALGHSVQIVGDDLFATNASRLQKGIDLGAANSVLVKVNQIGTLSETLNAMRLAQTAGYTRVVSARSGESEDATIADLAVGAAAEQIKIGSIVRSERLAKYNQLLRIEEELIQRHH